MIIMIKSNLAVLMAERGLKIVDVYKVTGISKTTLMSLADNKSQGVQFDTIDKLCNFFGVTPDSFFVFSRYILSYETVYSESLGGNTFVVKAVSENSKQVFKYECNVYNDIQDEIVANVYSGSDNLDYYVIVNSCETGTLGKIYRELPPLFKKDIDNKFFEFCVNEINHFMSVANIPEKPPIRMGFIINYDDDTRIAREFIWRGDKKADR